MKTPQIAHIAAITKNHAIGEKGALLFKIKEDMYRFKALTLGSTVLMGRKTWESLPEKFRPLPLRTNMVISRNPHYRAPGAMVFTSVEHALAEVQTNKVFVIGGEEVYKQTIELADVLELTIVDTVMSADAFYPKFSRGDFNRKDFGTGQEGGLFYSFVKFTRKKKLTTDVLVSEDMAN